MGTIGERIKQAAELRALSLNRLDELAGTAQGYASRITRGDRGQRIDPRIAEAIARVLDVRLEWLLRGTGPIEPERATLEAPADVYPERARAIAVARALGVAEEAIARVAGLSPSGGQTRLAKDWMRLMLSQDEWLGADGPEDGEIARPKAKAKRKT